MNVQMARSPMMKIKPGQRVMGIRATILDKDKGLAPQRHWSSTGFTG